MALYRKTNIINANKTKALRIKDGLKFTIEEFRNHMLIVPPSYIENTTFFIDGYKFELANIQLETKKRYTLLIYEKGSEKLKTEFIKLEWKWDFKKFSKVPFLTYSEYEEHLLFDNFYSFHESGYALNGRDLALLIDKRINGISSRRKKQWLLTLLEKYENNHPEEFI